MAVSPDAPFRIVSFTGGFNAAPGLLASTISEGAFVVTIDVSPTGSCVGDSLVLTINLSEVVIDAIADVFVRNVATGEVFLVGTGDFSGDFSQVTGVFDQVGLFDAWVTIDGVKSNEVRLISVGVDVSGPGSLTIGETVQLQGLAGPPGGTLTFVDHGGTGSVTLDPATGDVTGRLPGTVRIGATYTVAGVSCDDPTPLEITVQEPSSTVEFMSNLLFVAEDAGITEQIVLLENALESAIEGEILLDENQPDMAEPRFFQASNMIGAFANHVMALAGEPGGIPADEAEQLQELAEEAQEELEERVRGCDAFAETGHRIQFFLSGLLRIKKAEGGQFTGIYTDSDPQEQEAEIEENRSGELRAGPFVPEGHPAVRVEVFAIPLAPGDGEGNEASSVGDAPAFFGTTIIFVVCGLDGELAVGQTVSRFRRELTRNDRAIVMIPHPTPEGESPQELRDDFTLAHFVINRRAGVFAWADTPGLLSPQAQDQVIELVGPPVFYEVGDRIRE